MGCCDEILKLCKFFQQIILIEAKWRICVNKLTTIGSDIGLAPGRHQAIVWTNAGILWIRTFETNFSEI